MNAGAAKRAGMSPRNLYVEVGLAGTLSAFFGESGQENKYQPDAKYYLLTVVLHDQSSPIDVQIARYEEDLFKSSLPDVPFHAYDLQHSRGGYEGLDFGTRKKLFARFEGFVRRLPITYKTFVYRRPEFKTALELSERMQRDLASFIRENNSEFQSYTTVAIYYDVSVVLNQPSGVGL